MNTAIFDLSDPEVANALKACKVGEPKTITLTLTPKTKDASQMVADITGIESDYAEEEEAPPIETVKKKASPVLPPAYPE